MYGRNAAEFLDDLREVALEQLALSLRAMQAMKTANPPSAPPRGSRSGQRRDDREKQGRDEGDYLYCLAEAQLRYQRELLRIHSQHFEQVADRLRDLARRSYGWGEEGTGRGDAVVREEVRLERAGLEASGVFELENRTWSPIAPRFFSSTFEAGPTRAPVKVDVETQPIDGPREGEIRPGEAMRFRVVVRGPDDGLRRDCEYRGTLLAVDRGRVFAEVVLHLERARAAR
jgi:hypothetical protein